MSESLPYNYANTLPEGERNWGFQVNELDPSQRTTAEWDAIVMDPSIAYDTAMQHAQNNNFLIVEPGEQPQTPESYIRVDVDRDALAEQIGEPIDPVLSTVSDLDALDPKLSSALKAIDLRDQILEKAADAVYFRGLEMGHHALPEDCDAAAEEVSQIFDVSNGRGGSFSIINFSETILEGEPLQYLMNAVREMDELTGGTSTDDLKVLAIFPRSLPRWKAGVKQDAADVGMNEVLAVTTSSRSIILNEALIQPGGYKIKEEAEGKTVGSTRNMVETAMFHELTHLIEQPLVRDGKQLPSEKFGWDVSRDENGKVGQGVEHTHDSHAHSKSPSEYGSVDAFEDVAETATALFEGGKWADAVDDTRKSAIADLYAQRHNGQHGPAFVRCDEQDLKVMLQSGHQLGSRIAQQVYVRPNVTYQLK